MRFFNKNETLEGWKILIIDFVVTVGFQISPVSSNLPCPLCGRFGLCRGERFIFDTIARTTYYILIKAGGSNF
jgi:hypothetical protein